MDPDVKEYVDGKLDDLRLLFSSSMKGLHDYIDGVCFHGEGVSSHAEGYQ